MSAARPLTTVDLRWVVELLAQRRSALVPHAPLLWRPASDARLRHARHLARLLGEGGGYGVRTAAGVMIAAPGPAGWVVDDAWVPPGAWEDDGAVLWSAIGERVGRDPITVVCPAPEADRAQFVLARGLRRVSSWWHREVPSTSLAAGGRPRLSAAIVDLVPAPPIYDPGGYVTLVRDVADVRALDGGITEAQRCGSPLVVVDQPASDVDLGDALSHRGFVRHCDFLCT